MYVCFHICMPVCIYICVYVSVFVHVFVCVCLYFLLAKPSGVGRDGDTWQGGVGMVLSFITKNEVT